MESTIKLNVNGREVEVSAEPQRTLLDVLREELHLTGTKYGCGEGSCGACTVLANGRAIFSCSTPVTEALDAKIETIESLAHGDELHPVQQAFLEAGASQCGYCTPGMIMRTVALLNAKPNSSEAELIEGMNGNLCRCCNYVNILSAVRRAASNHASASR
jgi:aerobic-type carbon monoxide dehydrogenase small subunit (CoxS/CutS family)